MISPTTEIPKVVAGVAAVAVLIATTATGWHFGSTRATTKYEAKIDVMKLNTLRQTAEAETRLRVANEYARKRLQAIESERNDANEKYAKGQADLAILRSKPIRLRIPAGTCPGGAHSGDANVGVASGEVATGTGSGLLPPSTTDNLLRLVDEADALALAYAKALALLDTAAKSCH